jgi:Na+/glutamate symporter
MHHSGRNPLLGTMVTVRLAPVHGRSRFSKANETGVSLPAGGAAIGCASCGLIPGVVLGKPLNLMLAPPAPFGLAQAATKG